MFEIAVDCSFYGGYSSYELPPSLDGGKSITLPALAEPPPGCSAKAYFSCHRNLRLKTEAIHKTGTRRSPGAELWKAGIFTEQC
jgi:hypothetical protein